LQVLVTLTCLLASALAQYPGAGFPGYPGGFPGGFGGFGGYPGGFGGYPGSFGGYLGGFGGYPGGFGGYPGGFGGYPGGFGGYQGGFGGLRGPGFGGYPAPGFSPIGLGGGFGPFGPRHGGLIPGRPGYPPVGGVGLGLPIPSNTFSYGFHIDDPFHGPADVSHSEQRIGLGATGEYHVTQPQSYQHVSFTVPPPIF